MAVYNELQVGRYVRFFQKFFGMKGRAPAPLTFQGEIGATIGLMHGIENRYLEGWNTYQGYALLVASVGNKNVAQLRNPPGSNVIAVLEKLRIVTVTTDTISLSAQLINSTAALDQATAMAIFPWDNRPYSPNSAPSGVIVGTTGQVAVPANLGALWLNEQILNNTPQDLILYENQEIPLLPGVALRATGSTANVNQQFVFRWRERFLEDSERS